MKISFFLQLQDAEWKIPLSANHTCTDAGLGEKSVSEKFN
jgi:hypothetical protein